MKNFEQASNLEKEDKEKYFESLNGLKEPEAFVFDQIRFILEGKEENKDKMWTQPAELKKIANHWHNFDEEIKKVILVSIPEVSLYILKNKLEEIFKGKGSLDEQTNKIIEYKIDNFYEQWIQPAELNQIVDYWQDFNDEIKEIILIAIPEVASYLLKNKLKKLS